MFGNEKISFRNLSQFQDPREESKPHVALGIQVYQNYILQNLSEQDTCFDSKDLIGRERNAVDLYDQRDSKGQMSFISFKEGFLKTIYSWQGMY